MTEINISDLVLNEDEKNNQDHYCPICKNFLHPDKSSQTDCLHIFCSNCINIHMESSTTSSKRCPICRDYLLGDPIDLKKSNLFAYNYLSNIKIKCKNQKCDKTMKLSELDNHIKNCDYEERDCPFCDKKGLTKIELKKHIIEERDNHFIKMADKIIELEKELKILKMKL